MKRNPTYPPMGSDTWNAWCWRQEPQGKLDLHRVHEAKPIWNPTRDGEWVRVLVKEVKPK